MQNKKTILVCLCVHAYCAYSIRICYTVITSEQQSESEEGSSLITAKNSLWNQNQVHVHVSLCTGHGDVAKVNYQRIHFANVHACAREGGRVGGWRCYCSR